MDLETQPPPRIGPRDRPAAVGLLPTREDAPMPGGKVTNAIEDDARAERTWLRRLGVASVLVLAAVAIGFGVHVTQVQDQVSQAETTQRLAELDAQRAGIRLDSVDARVRTARRIEDEAQAALDRSRAQMEAQGLQEELLGDAQAKTAKAVKDQRARVKTVKAQIAEQGRLQPAASACLFDLLRALGRIGDAHNSGSRSEACTTVAATPGPS